LKKFLATLTIGLAIGAGLNAQGPGPTFSRDIAPIVYEHCVACHRPGEIGPFSLLTYSDVRQHATQIADVTRRRVMPPWKPAHGQVAFVGDRSLSDAQIQTVGAWVAQGAVEGNPSDLPPAPAAASGWQLGTPDLVVTMPAAYALQPAGTDVFRTFVIPIPTHEAKYVRAIEFRPGNSRAVHHANIGIDRTGSSRRLDAMDAEPGYVGGMVPDAAYPPGYMLGWTPGQRPRPSPDGMPWRLEASSDLVVQLHMQPTGKTEAVQISAGFYFTNDPPVQTPVGLRLGSETIDIPAGQTHYIVSDSYTLPVDVQVLAVQPHAHNLGRTMVATATLPDGSTRPLISIADWDFRWQDVYRYEHPMALPRGTVLYMEYSYDNSDGNARNTSHPPKHVVWGQNTTDEMGDLWVQMVPAAMADLAFLADDIGRKTRGEDLAAYTKLMNAEPGNPLRHDTVAMLSLQGGDAVAAAREFRASLRLNPDSAPTHYNLGIALSIERSYDEAMAEFREAIRVDPSYADAHNNLGALLTLTGQFDAAADHYRQALAIREDNADAHSNLARVLWAQGKGSEAVEHFRRASTLRPDAPSPMAGLAWIRATAPDVSMRNPVEAVTLGERAVALTGHRDPTVVDILAAAYASAGDFDRAAATAREALALASASGSKPLSDQIAARLSMYLQHVAFVSPQPATKP
jgi:tetratricopeptide (TPR) repeat protein/mono/diheme cytochrome c family protein